MAQSGYDDFDPQDEEGFPFPQRITREAFRQGLNGGGDGDGDGGEHNDDAVFDVDKFLFDHYRFTLLDDSEHELTQLLKEVDQELFDLLNNDYYDFINLGKTLDGGEGLVDRLRISVAKYQKKLNNETRKLDESSRHVTSALENLSELNKLKIHANNMILLDKFVNDFETLLSQSINSDHTRKKKPMGGVPLLKHLTSLYLTISKLLKSFPPYLPFVESKSDKLETLRSEYIGLLDDFIQRIDGTQPPEDVHTVLRIYTVVGEEKHAVKILKKDAESGKL